jgi:putative heme-binding domain-containing protein
MRRILAFRNEVLALACLVLLTLPLALRADDSGLEPLVQVLGEVDDAAVQADLLLGMREGLKGRKSVPMPKGWSETFVTLAKSENAAVREHAEALAIIFDDPQVLTAMRARVLSPKTPAAERLSALEILIDKRPADFAPTLQSLLGDDSLRRPALRGLAAYSDPQTAKLILAKYDQWTADEKQDALATLTSRRDYAMALVTAVEEKRVPRTDLLPVLVRQLHALQDQNLSARVNAIWGDVRETPQDKLAKIEKYKQQLGAEQLAQANLNNGRKVFARTCQQCHILYGEGAKIGPDLTGSNRANLEYVLTNVIDPSALIAREYKMNIVVMNDGRVLTGMIVERNGDRLTLQTVNERLTLDESDIEELSESAVSMMPEGQFDALSAEEVRDLVAYLATKKPLD